MKLDVNRINWSIVAVTIIKTNFVYIHHINEAMNIIRILNICQLSDLTYKFVWDAIIWFTRHHCTAILKMRSSLSSFIDCIYASRTIEIVGESDCIESIPMQTLIIHIVVTWFCNILEFPPKLNYWKNSMNENSYSNQAKTVKTVALAKSLREFFPL